MNNIDKLIKEKTKLLAEILINSAFASGGKRLYSAKSVEKVLNELRGLQELKESEE